VGKVSSFLTTHQHILGYSVWVKIMSDSEDVAEAHYTVTSNQIQCN